jgi:bleomycin hydrolase
VLAGAAAGSIWEAGTVLPMVRAVLDRDMGPPPPAFDFGGTRTTPTAFMKDVLGIDPDAYVSFMSTLKKPFYEKAELEVADNWWHDASYHNVPIEEFYTGLKGAIAAGYGVSIAIDVSEPGKDWRDSVMFVPEYDIPADRIDQLAREYRLANGATTDDHGVHVVGWTEHAGHDWFLVKDSGRSSRWVAPEGYYFVRDDYVRLKVLAYVVHRDAVKSLLEKFGE